MPTSTPLESTTGRAAAIVFAENIERFFLRIGYGECDESCDRGSRSTLVVERFEQKIADAQVVDQFAAIIDHVDDVERLAVLAVLAHVIEHFLHRPILAHRDEVRRHQTANTSFRITEKRWAMRRSSGVSNRISWRAAALGISSSNAVRSSGDISLRMAATCSCAMQRSNSCCASDVEILENVRRQRGRQDAKDDDAIVLRHIENDFGDIGRRPFPEEFTQAQRSCAPQSGCEFPELEFCRP